MYALRERRVHVTQEDFELAVAKVKPRCWFLFYEKLKAQYTILHIVYNSEGLKHQLIKISSVCIVRAIVTKFNCNFSVFLLISAGCDDLYYIR